MHNFKIGVTEMRGTGSSYSLQVPQRLSILIDSVLHACPTRIRTNHKPRFMGARPSTSCKLPFPFSRSACIACACGACCGEARGGDACCSCGLSCGCVCGVADCGCGGVCCRCISVGCGGCAGARCGPRLRRGEVALTYLSISRQCQQKCCAVAASMGKNIGGSQAKTWSLRCLFCCLKRAGTGLDTSQGHPSTEYILAQANLWLCNSVTHNQLVPTKITTLKLYHVWPSHWTRCCGDACLWAGQCCICW